MMLTQAEEQILLKFQKHCNEHGIRSSDLQLLCQQDKALAFKILLNYLYRANATIGLLTLIREDVSFLKARDEEGRTICLVLAINGCFEVFNQLLKEFPECAKDRDNLGCGITHYLAWGGHVDELIVFFQTHPERIDERNARSASYKFYLPDSNPFTANHIEFTALRRALPLLKSRVINQIEHADHALSELLKLADSHLDVAMEALEEACDFHCRRIGPLIGTDYFSTHDLYLLEIFATKSIPSARQTLKNVWWHHCSMQRDNIDALIVFAKGNGRSYRPYTDIAALQSLNSQAAYAALRLGEYYLEQSQKNQEEQPESRLNRFFRIKSTPADVKLLNKSKEHLDAALMLSVYEAHHVLGSWYASQQKYLEASIEYGKSLYYQSRYCQESSEQLEAIIRNLQNSDKIRCTASIMVWRYNKNPINLLLACEINSNEFVNYALSQKDCTPIESFVLLTHAILTLNLRMRECTQALQMTFNQLMNEYDELDDAMIQVDKFFDILARSPVHFTKCAMNVIYDDKAPEYYRAALLNKLKQMTLPNHVRQSVQRAWRALSFVLRQAVVQTSIQVEDPMHENINTDEMQEKRMFLDRNAMI